MRLCFLTLLFGLLWLAFVQGSNGSPGSSSNSNKKKCGRVFKKRDCADPAIFPDGSLFDPDLDVFPVDTADAQDPDDPSLESRGLNEFLTDEELSDPDLNRILSRDVLDRLDNGEDPDALIEGLLAEYNHTHDPTTQLDTYRELAKHLQKRLAYEWESKTHSDDLVKFWKRDGYYKICDGEGDLAYKTPPYAKGQVLYDNEKWKVCTNYNLEKKKLDQKSPLRKPKNDQGDGYIAEHVLERQMLQQFYREKLQRTDIPGRDEEYCAYMSRYWDAYKDSNGKIIEVLIPDITVTKDPEMPPLYLVGRAWPQTRANPKEIVTTEGYINKVKAQLFNSRSSVNADALFKMNSLEEVEAGHAWFKVSVLVGKYLAHEDIQKIYKVQGDRVGAAFKTAEDELEKYWAKKQQPYKRLGLDKMWLEWLGTYTKTVHKKLWDNIQKWDGKFKEKMEIEGNRIERARKDPNLSKETKKDLDDYEDVLNYLKAARKEVERLSLNPEPQLFGNPWAKAS